MEAEVFKRRHSITASCSRLMNDSEGSESSDDEAKPTRKLFQAKVQKLLAVRWFTQKRGIRLRHVRKSACCTDVAPTQEEEALLGKVLSSRHLMHKTMEMLQSFQREISGVDGFFDELGVEPTWVPGRLEDSLFDDKKESLMKLAVKAIHEAKWVSLRICYNEYMKQQEQELKVLKQNYEKLTKQFTEVRQDYLQEVATLRDQVRIRGDVDTSGWIDEAGGDVVYFFDPAKALSPKEAHFVLKAVKEKLMMILEHNPRIGGSVDLGQLEKLKELKENKELEELKAELLHRSRELLEAQRMLRKLQEEQLDVEQATQPPGRSKHRFERMMSELEDKVSQLRHDAAQLKRQLHAESKERHHAEESLEELKAEHQELRKHAEDLEHEHSLCQSEVRALREELDFAHARNMDLQDSEKALMAKMDIFQKSHDELIQVLQRKMQWESPEGTSIADRGTSDLFQDGTVASSLFEAGSLGKRQRSSDDLLEAAHQQVIEALQQKDFAASAAEDLRKENAQLRRELARQSRGVLLMDAETSSQKATDLAAFLGSLQNQLGASKTSAKGKGFSLSFPELEKRLADATEQAGTSLKAVLQALRKQRQVEAPDLQLLQKESLRSQQEKQQLERELFEARLQHLTQGLGGLNPRSKADDEKMQSLVSCSLQFLQSMSQTMQQLASENMTLRESLLTFSSSLSQASSMVSAKGHPELESLLSSITANAECAVPAVFRRLFNDSRKLDPRLEQEAQERREGLMKSLIYHLSEEQRDGTSRPVDHRISLRQGVEDSEEAPTSAPASARPRLLRQRSSMESLEEAPASARPRLHQQRSTKEDMEDFSAPHRPARILAQRSMEDPKVASAPVSAQARSLLDDHEDAWLNASRGSWSRQCSGASEVSNSSSRMSSKRQGFLGITSLEFKATPMDSMKATKLRIPRHKPEGLLLPQVPSQAGHSPASELQISGGDSGDARGESDLESSSDDHAEERKALPRVAVRAPQDSHHFLQSQMELQDRRISISDLKPPESSWPSRMKNALTGRRLSHLVRRPEPVERARRSSVS